MTEDEVRDRLKPYNAKAVSVLTGLPYFTVWRFIAGKTARPSWHVVSTLEAFLKEQGK
ncbi:MAG: hypothetical protein ACRCYS_12830 [Beijerinckiaceae bacterium]